MPSRKIDSSIDLPVPLDAAWQIASDTARVNLEAGSPAYQATETVQPDGTILRQADARLGPVNVAWEEGFGQWVDRRWTKQVRTFTRGPFDLAEFTLSMEPLTDRTTRIKFDGHIDWTSLTGSLLDRLGLVQRFVTARMDLIRRLAIAGAQAGGNPPALTPPKIAPAADQRLAATLADLRGRHDEALVDRLEAMLREAVATDLARLRPLALATAWQAPEDAVIALCLDAHKQGLLGLRWDLLCPRCRGGKSAVTNLYELPRGTHCSSCNIDYERDFTSNVELVFHPEAWLRPVASGTYCLLGPVTSPHVKLQVRLEAGETANLAAGLPAGRYRLRTLEPGPECDLDWRGESGFPGIVIGADKVSTEAPAPVGWIHLRNNGPVARHAVIEDRNWVAEALTGDRVLGLPAFRALCPEQVIRPGDEVAISSTCVLFADLKGSTALYAQLGDAAAYGLVRDYFSFFAERLRESGGILVKTMGDAVMATFTEPQAAVATALKIHRDAAAFGQAHGGDALISKIGIHAGPCVAVNTAGLMDFFGRTVNLAARLQAQSDGRDIVLTRELAEDPAVAALIAGLPAIDEIVQLRGIPEPTALRKVQVAARH